MVKGDRSVGGFGDEFDPADLDTAEMEQLDPGRDYVLTDAVHPAQDPGPVLEDEPEPVDGIDFVEIYNGDPGIEAGAGDDTLIGSTEPSAAGPGNDTLIGSSEPPPTRFDGDGLDPNDDYVAEDGYDDAGIGSGGMSVAVGDINDEPDPLDDVAWGE